MIAPHTDRPFDAVEGATALSATRFHFMWTCVSADSPSSAPLLSPYFLFFHYRGSDFVTGFEEPDSTLLPSSGSPRSSSILVQKLRSRAGIFICQETNGGDRRGRPLPTIYYLRGVAKQKLETAAPPQRERAPTRSAKKETESTEKKKITRACVVDRRAHRAMRHDAPCIAHSHRSTQNRHRHPPACPSAPTAPSLLASCTRRTRTSQPLQPVRQAIGDRAAAFVQRNSRREHSGRRRWRRRQRRNICREGRPSERVVVKLPNFVHAIGRRGR